LNVYKQANNNNSLYKHYTATTLHPSNSTDWITNKFAKMPSQVLVYSPDQVLNRGLLLAAKGWTKERLLKQKHSVKCTDFKALYGAHPIVVARMWQQLQTTKVKAARIDISKTRSIHLKNFLRSLHFLMRYPTETLRKYASGNTRKTVRKWCWYFVERIAALRAEKIVWPGDDEWDTTFIISVDGVQCRFHEVKHDERGKDPAFFAHKFNGPGLGYELALHLWKPRLVWLRKNNRTADSDLKAYRQELKKKIPAGKLVIADGGYRDKNDPKISTPNPYDEAGLKTFKARARMRQEAFHNRIKNFNCLTGQFRHSEERHGQCFEAICVILCFEMELVSPLFDV